MEQSQELHLSDEDFATILAKIADLIERFYLTNIAQIDSDGAKFADLTQIKTQLIQHISLLENVVKQRYTKTETDLEIYKMVLSQLKEIAGVEIASVQSVIYLQHIVVLINGFINPEKIYSMTQKLRELNMQQSVQLSEKQASDYKTQTLKFQQKQIDLEEQKIQKEPSKTETKEETIKYIQQMTEDFQTRLMHEVKLISQSKFYNEPEVQKQLFKRFKENNYQIPNHFDKTIQLFIESDEIDHIAGKAMAQFKTKELPSIYLAYLNICSQYLTQYCNSAIKESRQIILNTATFYQGNETQTTQCIEGIIKYLNEQCNQAANTLMKKSFKKVQVRLTTNVTKLIPQIKKAFDCIKVEAHQILRQRIQQLQKSKQTQEKTQNIKKQEDISSDKLNKQEANPTVEAQESQANITNKIVEQVLQSVQKELMQQQRELVQSKKINDQIQQRQETLLNQPTQSMTKVVKKPEEKKNKKQKKKTNEESKQNIPQNQPTKFKIVEQGDVTKKKELSVQNIKQSNQTNILQPQQEVNIHQQDLALVKQIDQLKQGVEKQETDIMPQKIKTMGQTMMKELQQKEYLGTMPGKVTELQNQIQELDKLNKQLQDSLQHKAQKMEYNIQQREDRIRKIEEQLAKLKIIAQKQGEKIKESKQEIKKKEFDFKNQKNQMINGMQNKEKQIRGLQESKEGVSNQLKEITQNFNQIKQHKQGLQLKYQEKENEIMKLQQDLQQSQMQLQNKQVPEPRKVTTQNEATSPLKFQEDLENISQSTQTESLQEQNTEQFLDIALKDLEEKNKTIEQSDAKIKQLQDKLNSLKQESELEIKKVKMANLQDFENQINNYNRRIDELTRKNAELQIQLNNVQQSQMQLQEKNLVSLEGTDEEDYIVQNFSLPEFNKEILENRIHQLEEQLLLQQDHLQEEIMWRALFLHLQDILIQQFIQQPLLSIDQSIMAHLLSDTRIPKNIKEQFKNDPINFETWYCNGLIQHIENMYKDPLGLYNNPLNNPQLRDSTRTTLECLQSYRTALLSHNNLQSFTVIPVQNKINYNFMQSERWKHQQYLLYTQATNSEYGPNSMNFMSLYNNNQYNQWQQNNVQYYNPNLAQQQIIEQQSALNNQYQQNWASQERQQYNQSYNAQTNRSFYSMANTKARARNKP